MFLKQIKIQYSQGELWQIRLFDIPVLQYEQTFEKKLKKVTFPFLRKPKKDKPVFYLKVNSKNYNYSIYCISHWINIVNSYGADFYILCDNKDIEYQILKRIEFPVENIKFIRSNRKKYKKIIKNTCTPAWEKAGYAHLTTYSHAQKHNIKEIWNIDADDTIMFASPAEVARCLKEVARHAKENNIHATSLDMHRSAFRGLQWTFGVTYTQMNLDIEKAMLTYARNKEWQLEYHNKVLNLPVGRWESNLDAYFTYLKDKKVLNLGTFNINNLYFIHWGNCFINFLLRTAQIAKNGMLYFPFSSSIDQRRKEIPIYEDVMNFDLNINEQDSYNFIHDLLYNFEKRTLALRENYDKNLKKGYEVC